VQAARARPELIIPELIILAPADDGEHAPRLAAGPRRPQAGVRGVGAIDQPPSAPPWS
jgi:hypothetical protein